jgi:hypothetical protein
MADPPRRGELVVFEANSAEARPKSGKFKSIRRTGRDCVTVSLRVSFFAFAASARPSDDYYQAIKCN